jgi:hypothetical protein
MKHISIFCFSGANLGLKLEFKGVYIGQSGPAPSITLFWVETAALYAAIWAGLGLFFS